MMSTLNYLSSLSRTSQLIIAGIITGVGSHLGYFIRGEHHMRAPLLARIYLVTSFLLLVYEVKFNGAIEGVKATSILLASYIISLTTSILIYRKLFHRLYKFPGPYLAGATKFWHVCKNLNSQNHVLLDKLHEKYGTFVRTGPSEITVFSAEAFNKLDGPANKCTKGAWYDFFLPYQALNTTRDKALHDHRRQTWNQAVTKKALADYDDRITAYGHKLEAHIANTLGKPVNVTQWFFFFAFDVMGEISFSRSFDMLESERFHPVLILLRNAYTILGPLSPVTWLIQLALSMPWIPVVKGYNTMLQWCFDRMSERIDMKDNKSDLASFLIDASRKTNSLAKDNFQLNGDAVVMVVAGSDTVSSTLTCLFYELTLHPQHAATIRSELSDVDVHDSQAMKSLPHLNGAINEVLRLHPAVPTGGARETPAEGITIEGQFIPGGTTIVAPRCTIGRSPSAFIQPNQFIPERWYSRQDLVLDRRAFNPFSMGRYSCVGKELALSEIRLVAALLLSKYEIAFAPGEDGKKCIEDMRDQFTAVPGELELVFSPLEKV